MNSASRAALAAEAIGTFALVFAGTGAIVVNDFSVAWGRRRRRR